MNTYIFTFFVIFTSMCCFSSENQQELLSALQNKRFAECAKILNKNPNINIRDIISLILKYDNLVNDYSTVNFIVENTRTLEGIEGLEAIEILEWSKLTNTGTWQNKKSRLFLLFVCLTLSKKPKSVQDFIPILDLMYEVEKDFPAHILATWTQKIFISHHPTVKGILTISYKYIELSNYREKENLTIEIKKRMLLNGFVETIDDYQNIFNFANNNSARGFIKDIVILISDSIELFFSMNPDIIEIGKFLNKFYTPYATIWNDADPVFISKIESYISSLEIKNISFEELITLPFEIKKNYLENKMKNNKISLQMEEIYLSVANAQKNEKIDNWVAEMVNHFDFNNLSSGDFYYLQKIINENISNDRIKVQLQQSFLEQVAKKQEEYRSRVVQNSLYEKIKDEMPTRSAKRIKPDDFTCSICLEELNQEESAQCPNELCQIKSCRECFNQSIDVQMKNQDYPVHCTNCNESLLLNDNNPKKMDSFFKGTIHYLNQKKFPGNKNCASVNCENRITPTEVNEKTNHYKCFSCKMTHCYTCSVNHIGKSCKAYLEEVKNTDLLNKLLHDPASNIRPCPWCYIATEKTEACDHMNCTQCKQRWDWKYGKTIGQTHYSKADGSEPREYRIPGEE